MSSVAYDYLYDFATIFNSMKLEDSSIAKLKVAKEFSENTKRINCIDFSQDGRSLITSSDDDTIVLYDCEKGFKKRDIASKKYGVDHIKYTHANNTALHTSTKENDTIRYLSLHDNKYLRYFVGHTERVVTLCMSPADDTFLSGSLDRTIRVWDLREEKSIALLHFKPDNTTDRAYVVANYDPEGLIFAAGINNNTLKFFDVRQRDKGPFNTIKLEEAPANLKWETLKFSPDGKQMLITTNMEEMYILDAFSGQPQQKLMIGPQLSKPLENPCEASYTPDSQYILSGATDGCLHVFSACKGTKVAVLKPERTKAEPVQCVKFNPKYMLLASACSRMSFWIPALDEIV